GGYRENESRCAPSAARIRVSDPADRPARPRPGGYRLSAIWRFWRRVVRQCEPSQPKYKLCHPGDREGRAGTSSLVLVEVRQFNLGADRWSMVSRAHGHGMARYRRSFDRVCWL